jgi:carbon monoxide dehydrogenase subunit G
MLHFEGDKDLPLAPADLFGRLSDARFLVQCIPGVEAVSKAGADEAVCVLRPGFSFVRGTLEVTLHVVERTGSASLGLVVSSKGIGSTSTVAAALHLATQAGGTRIHWTADIQELGGLLKAMPPGLIKASAQKVIADVWSVVEEKIKTEERENGR